MTKKTQEELDAELNTLKQKYGIVRTFICPLDTDDETNVATVFLKKPDKGTRDMVSKLVKKEMSEKAIAACLKQLYIGGDNLDLILTNDDAMEAADFGVAELLMVQKATIKKN